jgi:DNA invertase Pin-like site-specific DNA recombinase
MHGSGYAVLGYVRVATEELGDSGAGLEAQRRAIAAECKRRGWRLRDVIEDAGYSAKDLRRPGIQAALEVLESGDARALVAAKLDRLSRSMLDFTALMAKAQKQGWALVALDCAVDDAGGRGDGERARNVCAVRAAADFSANARGACRETRERRGAGSAAIRRRFGRAADRAGAGSGPEPADDRGRVECRPGTDRPGRQAVVRGDRTSSRATCREIRR